MSRLSAPWLMLGAALLFSLMGVCVKLASAHYQPGEIVMYRGLVGALIMAMVVRARGGSLRTPVPGMHLWRSVVGVASLSLWFYAFGNLPLATAMTLNYMSSVWMALFLVGGAIVAGGSRIDPRLVVSVLVGFAGVALVLRPTIAQNQLWHGVAGLLSGVLAALAYLQVTALGRVGEPEDRVVFYFSLGGVVVGAVLAVLGGVSAHTPLGALQLLGIGGLATGAQWMMTRAYAVGRPLTNAALQYAGIVFSCLWGALFFGEGIAPVAVLGIALIIAAGMAATALRGRRLPEVHPAD